MCSDTVIMPSSVTDLLETMYVKTVKSRTGGVHKRFTMSSSGDSNSNSDSDSDKAEEATQKALATSISDSQDSYRNNERRSADFTLHSSWDTGTSAETQVPEHGGGTKNCRARSSLRITGGRKDTFRAVSTVIHVPARPPVECFDSLPDLCGLPRVGDKIAFKVNITSLCGFCI